jgi:hypothetical protein
MERKMRAAERRKAFLAQVRPHEWMHPSIHRYVLWRIRGFGEAQGIFLVWLRFHQ